MRNQDTKHLRLKGNIYQFQLWVPKTLKHHPMFCGKQVYIKSLGTSDLPTAKRRREQLLSEIDLMLNGSKAAEFRAHVDQMREMNRQFHKDNPLFDDDIYGLEYEEIEHEARKRGIRLDEEGHLPADLPSDLKYKLDVLSYACKQDSSYDTPLPSAYQESLRDLEKRTIELKRQLGNREKTIKKYSRSVDVFLRYLKVKDIPIVIIRRKHVVEFSMAMQTQYSGSTVSNFLSFLSEMWKVARDLELLDGENPFQGHKVRDDKEKYLPWSESQLKDLYHLIPESDRLPFKIGVYTGARQDEIMSLQPEDVKEIETDDGKVLCIHLKSKGKGERLIPVHAALIGDLKGFKGFSCTASAYSKRFGKVKKAYLGENNSRLYNFHSIRHTLATALHRAGIDELVISHITGHANVGRTEASRTYIRGPLMRQMQEALERLPVIV